MFLFDRCSRRTREVDNHDWEAFQEAFQELMRLTVAQNPQKLSAQEAQVVGHQWTKILSRISVFSGKYNVVVKKIHFYTSTQVTRGVGRPDRGLIRIGPYINGRGRIQIRPGSGVFGSS